MLVYKYFPAPCIGLARRMGYNILREFETGEMLKSYMEDLGLSNVRKDKIKVDGWEFEKAVLAYRNAAGERKEVQLGAYQTDFVTEGPETFQVVYVGITVCLAAAVGIVIYIGICI